MTKNSNNNTNGSNNNNKGSSKSNSTSRTLRSQNLSHDITQPLSTSIKHTTPRGSAKRSFVQLKDMDKKPKKDKNKK
jgi:hypothetical protein